MAAMNAKLNCMQFLIDNLKIDVDVTSETGKIAFSVSFLCDLLQSCCVCGPKKRVRFLFLLELSH